MSKQAISTPDAPQAIGPYSQAIVAPNGAPVFLSGQIALDPATGLMVEGDIAAQTHQVMANLRAVLKAAGGDWSDVVKTTIFLQDMADFAAVNAVYAQYLQSPYPARATVQAAGLPKGAAVEIDAVAVIAKVQV